MSTKIADKYFWAVSISVIVGFVVSLAVSYYSIRSVQAGSAYEAHAADSRIRINLAIPPYETLPPNPKPPAFPPVRQD